MSSRKNLNKLNKNLNQEDLTPIYYKENRWEKKRKSKERDIKKLSFSKNVNPVKDIYKIYNSDNLKNKSNPNDEKYIVSFSHEENLPLIYSEKYSKFSNKELIEEFGKGNYFNKSLSELSKIENISNYEMLKQLPKNKMILQRNKNNRLHGNVTYKHYYFYIVSFNRLNQYSFRTSYKLNNIKDYYSLDDLIELLELEDITPSRYLINFIERQKSYINKYNLNKDFKPSKRIEYWKEKEDKWLDEKHFYSGMRKCSTGRNYVRNELKKIKDEFNRYLNEYPFDYAFNKRNGYIPKGVINCPYGCCESIDFLDRNELFNYRMAPLTDFELDYFFYFNFNLTENTILSNSNDRDYREFEYEY